MAKATKSSLTRKLDKVCSLIVRKNPCAKCGEAQYDKLQCAHIFSRTYRSVRWDLLNLLSLCASCHFWAHRNPILFQEFIYEYLGENQYFALKQRAAALKKWSLTEMVEMYAQFKRFSEHF